MNELKFNVTDWYEGKEVLGKGVSIYEAIKLVKQREEDTDGECDVVITTNVCGEDITLALV